MMDFVKKHRETVIFVGLIVFATTFTFWRSVVTPNPVMIYKTTQPSKLVTTADETSAFAEHAYVQSRGSHSHAHAQDGARNKDTSTWRDVEDFETFDKLLKTDPENAREALQKISKNFFRGHLLAEEWVPLYFRIARDGFRHISDIKRMHELELRMLTAIDVGKYAQRIQQHQEAIEYYTEHPNLISNVADGGGNETHIPEKNHPERDAAVQHFQNFFKMIDTDPEAAHTELKAYTALLFQNHPLTEEWNQLFFHIVDNEGGLVPEIIRFMELKKQMLTDTDPETFASKIKYVEQLVKELKRIEKIYESEGRLETQKIPFVMEYGK